MFSPFLKQVADDLLSKFDGNLKDLTIVLPSKRGGLFFNRYLAELTDHPVWAPAYTTMDELFQSMTELEVADQPLLIFHLYAAYAEAIRQASPEPGTTVESLDQFYAWGEVMLSDFDDIDNNLAHADKIFANMKDLEDLTTLDYLTEEQQKAIEHYFGIFEVKSDSQLKQKFLSIWNILYPTYQNLRQRLLRHKLAYQGMLRRKVVEEGLNPDKLKSQKYVFVGFNVLNKTEHKLLDMLRQEGRALFYWDYDKAFIKPDSQGDCFFEAGRYIRENLKHFGCEFPADAPCYDNMSHKKHISYVASPSNSGETRFAGELIARQIKADERQHHSAVVLCDEKMLQSMLHSMPEKDADGTPFKMNVTMGFPLIQTPAAGLVMTLLELHVFGDRNGKWYYTYVANVLKHPYTVRMTGGKSAVLLDEIKDKHQFFVDPEKFQTDPFLNRIFCHQKDIDGLLAMLSQAMQEIALSYVNADTRSFDIQLYQESLYSSYTLLNRLAAIRAMVRTDEEFLTVRDNDMSTDHYLKLIRQMMQSTSVPFHGEPAEGLQIIGLLETRCLDFENVVITGMNDENIPKAVKRTSFIPYTLREAHGMTTFEARASLYAYSFYHLIQRASDITLVYNNSVDELSKGDMSRFMTQLLVEQDEMFGGNLTIEQTALEAKVQTSSRKNLSVRKTDEVMERLIKRFTGRILSPSAINSYITCPFKFYLEKVAALKPDDDISEEVGNDVFGDIFHHTMEHLYKPLAKKILLSDTFQKLKENERQIEQYVDDGFRKYFFKVEPFDPVTYNGEQMLNRTVIIEYVKKQLDYDAHLCPLRIDAVENDDHKMEIRIGEHSFILGGIIDRIDTIRVGTSQERHRIVDYKTSATPQGFSTVDELFDSQRERRAYHILQAFYYSDIYTESTEQPVAPALMYIKPASIPQTDGTEDESIIKCAADQESGSEKKKSRQPKTPVLDFATQMKQEFHERMTAVINEMFSKDVDFTQTTNLHACTYCDFKQICGREGKR